MSHPIASPLLSYVAHIEYCWRGQVSQQQRLPAGADLAAGGGGGGGGRGAGPGDACRSNDFDMAHLYQVAMCC
jgi:hypothetical protein